VPTSPPKTARILATVTDVNGNFVINAEPGTVFRVTYVGYKETTFTVLSGKLTYPIIIKESKTSLPT
jgi:hypothetical protein